MAMQAYCQPKDLPRPEKNAYAIVGDEKVPLSSVVDLYFPKSSFGETLSKDSPGFQDLLANVSRRIKKLEDPEAYLEELQKKYRRGRKFKHPERIIKGLREELKKYKTDLDTLQKAESVVFEGYWEPWVE